MRSGQLELNSPVLACLLADLASNDALEGMMLYTIRNER